MISDLVLHPRTKQDVAAFIEAPTHSLLLVGGSGAGKPTLAKQIIAQTLQTSAEKLEVNPYYLYISPEKSSISIELVRQLQDFVRLKTTGTNKLRRAILIEDAHTMTVEAQNAFLKLLEEPPSDTIIVMTVVGANSLLPTITSRAPKIVIKLPLQKDLSQYFEGQGKTAVDIMRAFHLSRGQAGMMARLLNNQEGEALEYIDQAKQFLAMKPFERLVFVDKFTKQKQDLAQFLWALQRISGAALHQAANKDAQAQVVRWQKTLATAMQAQDNLYANPQAKLLLTDLSLQI